MDRMTMADRHRRAERNVFRHGSDRRKHQQAFNMSVVVALDAMRLEH
jgi:hypothetical protein